MAGSNDRLSGKEASSPPIEDVSSVVPTESEAHVATVVEPETGVTASVGEGSAPPPLNDAGVTAGDLDLSFGTAGRVTTPFSGACSGLVIQPDGAIVVVGYTVGGADVGFGDFAVARYTPDGALDPSFGNADIGAFDFAQGEDKATSVAIQSDGRILIVGSVRREDSQEFGLVRLDPNGSPDHTFGQDGFVFTQIPPFSYAWASCCTVQPDGRILAAGDVASNDEADVQDFAVVRYLADGSLDPTFGNQGAATTDFDGGYDKANAIAMQPDGKIVVAGRMAAHGSAYGQVGVTRFNADGAPDSDFGNGGTVTTKFEGKDAGAQGIIVAPDGRIVVAGFAGDENFGRDAVLVCYLPNGDLDPAFGTGGVVVSQFGRYEQPTENWAWINSLVRQVDGLLVAAGFTSYGGEGGRHDFVVARYDKDGQLDPSFGDAGIVTTDFGGLNDNACAVALQEDGRIVAAGNTGQDLGFALARYMNPPQSQKPGARTNSGPVGDQPAGAQEESSKDDDTEPRPTPKEPSPSEQAVSRQGQLDADFGTGGVASAGLEHAEARCFAMQPDGKILVAGAADLGDTETGLDFVIARFTPEGTLDEDFGSGGISLLDLSGVNKANALAVQPDGRILMAGQIVGTDVATADFCVARLLPNGDLDQAFGDGGATVTDILGDSHDVALSLAVQQDGRIVAAGFTTPSDQKTRELFLLARYLNNGSLDTEFGPSNTGIVTTDIRGGRDGITVVLLQPDDKILVAGWSAPDASDITDFIVARYVAQGELDQGFGDAGVVTTDFGRTEDVAYALVLQPDDKIVVAGYTGDAGRRDVALARYEGDGTPDVTFGPDGLVMTDFGGIDDEAVGAIVDSSGRIVVAGSSTPADKDGCVLALARFQASGEPDTAFGPGSIVTIDLGNRSDVACGLAVRSDGSYLVAGTSHGSETAEPIVACFRDYDNGGGAEDG